ncbi:MAG TPA: CHRD domain-containing protein [Thermoleophilaceae bacterium]
MIAGVGSAEATTYSYKVFANEPIQTATGLAGDPGGEARSIISMDNVSNTVCATTKFSGIDSPVVMGHVHAGAYGEPENPAVTIDLFPANFNGVTSPASGCTMAAPGVIDLIHACPSDYNTVIHSKDHPWAAVRGQLGTGAC